MDVKRLIKPALFLCGEYGAAIGSSHTTIIDDSVDMSSASAPLKKPYLAATVAWLRWQLAPDQTMKPWFVTPDRRFCMKSAVGLLRTYGCDARAQRMRQVCMLAQCHRAQTSRPRP